MFITVIIKNKFSLRSRVIVALKSSRNKSVFVHFRQSDKTNLNLRLRSSLLSDLVFELKIHDFAKKYAIVPKNLLRIYKISFT